jgi:cysteinyl-tRNA synthetase
MRANGADGEMTQEEQEAVKGFDEYRQKFITAMDDDLNTADGISAVFELISSINARLKGGATKAFAEHALSVLTELCDVLGLLQQSKEGGIDPEIQALIDERQAARKAKDFARADEIRDQLKTMGITLKDTPQGVQVIKG